MRRDGGVRRQTAGAPAAALGVAVTPDRHHWWDGSSWQAAPWPSGAVTVAPHWNGWGWRWPGMTVWDSLAALIERLARTAVAIEIVLAWIGALAMTTTPQITAARGTGNLLAGAMLLAAGGGGLACVAAIWRAPLLPPPSLVLAGVAWVVLGWLVGFAADMVVPAVVGCVALTCMIVAASAPRARTVHAVAALPPVRRPATELNHSRDVAAVSPWAIGFIAGVAAAGVVAGFLVLIAGIL